MPVKFQPLPASFGPWLQRFRKSRNLYVGQVAERGGLHMSTITAFEHNRMGVNTGMDTWQRLARGLDIEVGFLLHKAGYDIGRDGDAAQVQRAQRFTDEFMRLVPSMRVAIAGTMREIETGKLNGNRAQELGLVLAHLDFIAEAVNSTET